MAKFGSFVYSSAKYGTGDAEAQPVITGAYTYSLMVKWAGAWVNEAGRCVDVEGHRGRQYYVARAGDTVDDMQPGWFTFTLDNYDGRYDPYNTGSPLTGTILPGRAVEFRVRVEASGVTYPVFTGRIRDIVPVSGENMVKLEVVDALQWLSDQDATIPMATNIKVSDAINLVLDTCNYPGARAVSASNCPITYFDPQEANALDIIRQLTDAGIGTAFVDKRGVFYYYDLVDSDREEHNIDQAVLLKQIAVSQPWENVRNKVTCVANRFGYGPLQEVWRLDEPILILPNSSKTIKITFEAANVIQPVRYVDYWSGSSLTGFVPGVGYSGEQFFITASLTNITSTSADLVVTSSVITNAMYLRMIVIRGNKIVNKKISFATTDASSITSYGPRRFVIDSPWLQDRGFAEAYSTLLLNHLKTPSKSPIVTFENREDALDIELLDQINLTSAKLGISAQYDVGGIDYRWLNPTGQGWQVTMYLQNILYSTATITPQPYYPQVPPVPPETPGGSGGGPEENPGGTPTWSETLNCLTTYPVAQGASGPKSWPAGEINNSQTAGFAVDLWFRSFYHPYRTYIEIDGVWESMVGGAWTPDATWDFESITGYNITNQSVLTGSLSGGMVADGTRRYVFNNGHAWYIKQLNFVISTGGDVDFVIGSLLSSGSINANDGDGVDITGLSVDSYYGLKSQNGPYTLSVDGLTVLPYNYAVSNDGGSNWGGSLGLLYNNGYYYSLVGPSWAAKTFSYDSYHGGFFWQATTTSIKFIAHAAQDPNNISHLSGALGWELYSAILVSGDKRIRVRSMKIYNYCEGQPSAGPQL